MTTLIARLRSRRTVFWALAFALAFASAVSLYLNLPYLSTHLISKPFVPFKPENTASQGRWGPKIPAPLISVAAAVLPHSGRVLLFAADGAGAFHDQDSTITALYDPADGNVTVERLADTKHGMFCPGLSLDAEGQPFVSGGLSDRKVSIYDEVSDTWSKLRDMNIGRGYHAQVTVSNGNIFTIGGSWAVDSGAVIMSSKPGEVFEAVHKIWKPLPGCLTGPLLTNDSRGALHSDNHAWLFAWKNESVFQAGPSSNMNWYRTYGSGSCHFAGRRAQDGDSMNGNAVMYDAIQGKILTLGGAPSYSNSSSTKSAHVITLSNDLGLVEVDRIMPMNFPRVYANSVILPSGQVFINGGASYARQWTNVNASLTPELWSPITRRFTKAAKSSIPRTYHSTALLLPDATVLTGGGGLCRGSCWDPSINHFDLQVYYPPYLFDHRGRKLSRRPEIVNLSRYTVQPGETIWITTNRPILQFALIRYSSVTHSINTDQRRVALKALHMEAVRHHGRKRSRSQIIFPRDPGIMTPGYWMIFALSKEGVPSIAATICVLIEPAILNLAQANASSVSRAGDPLRAPAQDTWAQSQRFRVY